MIRRILTCLAGCSMAMTGMAAPPAGGVAGQPRVAFDAHSLIIDGKPTVIWSGEFHPFRLPSPDLWRDIFQKMKAVGFNAVSIYFDWGYHSDKPGSYDFTGIRDMDLVLRMAAEEGLYVIARPGPYVNAELTRGGFPNWLVNQQARARTDDPEYLAAADEWLGQIDAIIARHQLTDGKGSVILYQVENELPQVSPAHVRYMDHLAAKARADGITVPLFHNDQGRNGYWVPRSSNVPKTIATDVDLYAFDSYPGGACTVDGRITRDSPAPDFGAYGPGGAKGGASASPKTPGFVAEYGAGWFDYWGSNGAYDCNALQKGSAFERIFYGTNIANGLTIHNVYMAYGGTSWGWLPAPVVYTSYDYGAAIDEARGLRPKAQTLKQLGGLLAAVPDMARMERADGYVTASSDRIRVYHNRNPQSDARFLLVTHQPSNATSDDTARLTANLPDGRYSFDVRLNGFDAKWLLAGVNLARQHLVYSTSELQTALRVADRDVALFYGRDGERGETLLRYAHAPAVRVLEGSVQSSFDASRGDLKLTYSHGALARVMVEGGGRPPLLVLIGNEVEGAKFWRHDLPSGGVLVRGPALLRDARIAQGGIDLTGDMAADGTIELWAPDVRRVRWNGRPIAVRASTGGGLVSANALPGPPSFPLPDLQAARWRVSALSPESRPDFDDAGWRSVAAGARNVANIRPPDGQPNLAMDANGFHEGDVWYRGRFRGGADLGKISLHYGAGAAGLIQVWLDGTPLGQAVVPSGLPSPITTDIATLALPKSAWSPGEHLLAIMVRNNAHNEDLQADDTHKEPRGLISASIEAGGRSFAIPIQWKIQGGPAERDPARGIPNNGGLHGERSGWHLPGFDDHDWQQTRVPDSAAMFGTRWYRTNFDLAVPKGVDATIGLAIGDAGRPRSGGSYRVLIFVNGWNMGQYVADVGPQHVFPIPEGILDHRGANSLALAVTSDGAPGSGLEPVRLVTLRSTRGGLKVRQVDTKDSAR